jgi:hypothetical protein
MTLPRAGSNADILGKINAGKQSLGRPRFACTTYCAYKLVDSLRTICHIQPKNKPIPIIGRENRRARRLEMSKAWSTVGDGQCV